MQAKRHVVLGILGKVLDRPRLESGWRPTVDLCRHDALPVARLELLVHPGDDELAESARAEVRSVSPETEVRLHRLGVADPWDLEKVYAALHDFARGYAFDTDREDYLVHITTGTHVEQICLFLLTESRHLPARLLQTSPPRRPGDPPQGGHAVVDLDLSRYAKLASRFREERRDAASFLKSGIATRNAGFNRLVERIERVAIASKAPILLTGPTGSGKSLLARRIYELKKARHQVAGAFVELNCATLRGDAAVSALFGHVKGAFTGALSDRAGLLRAADGGMLFLDEIGELGQDEQAMLLRALEEGVFLPLGADREATSRFQLVCGTNRDLAAAVWEGRFREDLLARIDLWTFRLPGLAERHEDIEPNLEHELAEHTRRTGVRVGIAADAREAFLAFAASPKALWRGNFRDFNASLLRMATLAPGGRIDLPTVREEILRLEAGWHRPDDGAEDARLVGLLGPAAVDAMDAFDRMQLTAVLRVCERAPSLSAAGRSLFAASRVRKASVNDADRLRKYLLRFGLSWATVSGQP